MLKNISNLGTTLDKKEQRSINGGELVAITDRYDVVYRCYRGELYLGCSTSVSTCSALYGDVTHIVLAFATCL